jgi:hypothetical protein
LGTIVIWVHYEKIKRICTFCAKLFHNAEHCPDRIQRILAAGEDINFDQYGLWMTQIHRIPMQLVETQLTSYQDILPGPSSALSELRQAFAGVRMGASLVMQSRGPQPSNTQASTQLTTPVSSAPLQTVNVTAVEAMNVDNSAIVPLRTVMATPTDNMHVDTPTMLPPTTHPITSTQPQLQSHHLTTHGQLNSSSMLQFNQFNTRQTQVRVQVTTQPALSPTLAANQRNQLTMAIPTLPLNNQMMPLTVQHSPQQQSDLPILPSGPIITPPTQQLQRPPGAHPGH